MAHTFCPLPWKHLSTVANGDIRVCCQCTHAPFGLAKRPDGSIYNAARDDAGEVRNAEIFREIRSQMLSGEKPHHCQLCWKEEELGHKSRRVSEIQRSGADFEKTARAYTTSDGTIDTSKLPVTDFDLRLGNHCNFKCRSCGPKDSSSWYDDYAKINIAGSIFRFKPTKFEGRYDFVKKDKRWVLDTNDFSWHEDSVLLKKLEENLDHVERIYFTGGEPTLIRAHWRLLEKLIEKGRAPYIWLDYNTNASAITEEWLSIWQNFSHVFLGCSVDAIGDKAVYIRPPVEWNVIEKNLEKVAAAGGNIKASLSTTVSIYNVLHYPEMLEYLWEKNWENFHFLPFGQALEHPAWMNIQILPLHAKKEIELRYRNFFEKHSPRFDSDKREMFRAKLEYILGFMNQNDRSGELREFFRKTEQLDRLRGQSFSKTFPELLELLR